MLPPTIGSAQVQMFLDQVEKLRMTGHHNTQDHGKQPPVLLIDL
jgi:hypothetical protein